MELIGSCHSYENNAAALDQQKTKVEQVFDGHKFGLNIFYLINHFNIGTI